MGSKRRVLIMQLPRVWIVGVALSLLVVAALLVVFSPNDSPSDSSTDLSFSESSRNVDLHAIHPTYLMDVKDHKFKLPPVPEPPRDKFNIRSRENTGNCLAANMVGTSPVYVRNCANDELWQALAYGNEGGANFYNVWQREHLGPLTGGRVNFDNRASRSDVYELSAKSHSNDWHAFQLRQGNLCIDGRRGGDWLNIGTPVQARYCGDPANFFFDFMLPDASERPQAQQMLNGFIATMSCLSTVTATIGTCTAGEVVTVGAGTLACAGAVMATPAACSALLSGAAGGGF